MASQAGQSSLAEVMGVGYAALRTLIHECPFCVAVPHVRRIPRQREFQPCCGDAARRQKNRRMLEGLNGVFLRLRQSGLDDELMDVISGYEALSTGKARRSEV